MIIIVGLVILIAAVIAGGAGVLANAGHAHPAGDFAVFGSSTASWSARWPCSG